METDDPTLSEDIDASDDLSDVWEHITAGTMSGITSDSTPACLSESVDAASDTNIIAVEQRPLPLPSRSPTRDNVYSPMELELRTKQADRSLQSLRDCIADKSFQYSHVIRVAPRKDVRSRARSVIAKLNQKIAFHARVYMRCRSAIESLGATNAILTKYRPLVKADIKSSTALLNPNEPGSTTLRLSWIWQTGNEPTNQTPAMIRECMASQPFILWSRPDYCS
jgi:hypothetical protein